MKIAIDIRALAGIKTGIGRLLENLLIALDDYAVDNEIILFYNSLTGNLPPGIPQKNHFVTKRTHIPNRILNVGWAYSDFPKIEYIFGDIDIYYSPNFQSPPARRARRVVTIHDLVFYTNPELAMPEAVRHYKYRIKHYISRADIITADSNATASEISGHLGADPRRIRTIYPGVTPLKDVSTDYVKNIMRKYNLDNFILFVGCLEPRKNLVSLFEAFEHSKLYNHMTLTLAGPRGWRFEKLESVWNRLRCKDRIRWLNYVSDNELSALYRKAEFLAFPSLAEGFGLPILEAMSVGCPVVTSNISSMPEVAGDAAFYVDPFEVESISEGLLKLASDSGLRKKLAESGRARCREFTWQRMADQLMASFADAVNGNFGRK